MPETSLRYAFASALGVMAVNGSTRALFVSAMKDVAVNGASAAQAGVTAAVLLVVTLAPVIAPLVVAGIGPAGALRGETLLGIMPELAVLAGFALVLMTLAVWRFRRALTSG